MKTRILAVLGAAVALTCGPQAQASSPKNYKEVRLSKYVVETAYACLRIGMSENKDSGALYRDCVTHTEKQVEPLNVQMKFRLALLVYRTTHAWAVKRGVSVKLPAPSSEENKCLRDANPSACMTKITAQAFVEYIEILSDIGKPGDLESLRDALVESGG